MKILRAYVIPMALVFAISGSAAWGSTLYSETASGDLSNSQSAPTSVTAVVGTNSISGTVGNADSQDWITITVPAGAQLSSFILSSYASADSQGFMGVQAGSSFLGDPFAAGSYLGYVHYGSLAQNGALAPTNLVGADLLPLMGNTSLAAGSTGFTTPLGAGQYTFLIQQLGSATTYQFDVGVTAVAAPEVTTLGMLGVGATALLLKRRRIV
ncbi:MAG TPA: hypothetical protein VGN88_05300 [Phycisphaerae bacterium]|jgi:hypothetical protein